MSICLYSLCEKKCQPALSDKGLIFKTEISLHPHKHTILSSGTQNSSNKLRPKIINYKTANAE